MINYTTTDRVRLESGLKDEVNILDATVLGYQDQATGIINGIVGKRYNLVSMLGDPDFLETDACRILARCEELLGAGHLLNKHFHIQDDNANTDGDKKINDAYQILNEITAGNIKLLNTRYETTGTPPNEITSLVIGTGTEYPTLSVSSAGTIVGYPDSEEGRDFTKNTRR